MSTINYIIATSADATTSRKKDPYANFALRYQLDILSRILEESSCVKQVTIVRQEAVFVDEITKIEYYDTGKFLDIIRSKNIKVEFLDVPKKGISYTQYLLAYEAFPDYDYYLIMEDDWSINLQYSKFDHDLLELYKNNFLCDVGFLDCWSPKSGKHVGIFGGFAHHPHHSAITLGLLSNATIKNLINHINHIQLDLASLRQFLFSKLLMDSGSEIIDLPRAGFPTKILFWETPTNAILDFTEDPKVNEAFFVPVQFYYRFAPYFGYKKGNEENLFGQ